MVTFARRMPRLLVAWVGLVLITTLAVAIDLRHGGELYARLWLAPDRVWRGEVWRLVTWIFVEGGPESLIFGCLAIYAFGGDLLEVWGERRFVRRLGGIALGTGVGTALVAPLVPGAAYHGYFGAGALGDALLIAWGLAFPTRQVRIWMVLPIDGRTLAIGLALVTGAGVLFYGLAPMLPWVIAGALAFASAGRASRRRFRVVRGERPPPSGPYAPN